MITKPKIVSLITKTRVGKKIWRCQGVAAGRKDGGCGKFQIIFSRSFVYFFFMKKVNCHISFSCANGSAIDVCDEIQYGSVLEYS